MKQRRNIDGLKYAIQELSQSTKIGKGDITELTKFYKPPEAIVTLFAAVATAFE